MPRMDEIAVLLYEKDGMFYAWQDQLVEDSRKAQETPSAAITEILTACQAGGRPLAGYLASYLGLSAGDMTVLRNVCPVPGALSVGEYSEVPAHKEWDIALNVGNSPESIACNPLFWVLVSWTSYDQGRCFGDAHAAHLVRAYTRKQNWKQATRDILRWLGGAVVSDRQRLGVFLDCQISRAWWRVRIAQEVSDNSTLFATPQDAHKVLCIKAVWRPLMESVASRFTVMCDPAWRAGALEACATAATLPGAQKVDYKAEIDNIARASLIYCAALR